jgi:hypothetical protein
MNAGIFPEKLDVKCMKENYQLEYVFDNASLAALWSSISTPEGLSTWFADDVLVDGERFTFVWNKFQRNAELLQMRLNKCVRFKWEEDDPQLFFELNLSQNELTNDIVLTISDFSDADELEDAIDLWNTQIEQLRINLGL